MNNGRRIEAYLDGCLPTTCCGCCEPRMGVMIVATLSFISNIFNIGSPSVPSGNSLYNWTITLNVFSLLLALVGLFGAYKFNYSATKVYAYTNFVGLFMGIVTLIALAANASRLVYASCMEEQNATEEICNMVSSNAGLFIGFLAVVIIPLQIYICLVTWAFYRSLGPNAHANKDTNQQYFPANDDDIAVSSKV
jgi:hypothetical protein